MRASKFKLFISLLDVYADVSFNVNHFLFVCEFQQDFHSYSVLRSWGFLIVRIIDFLQAFEENFPFAAYKAALIES